MTNLAPFSDDNDATVFVRVLQGDLPSFNSDQLTILAMCSLLSRCWTKEPSERPTAKKFLKSIDWMVSNAGL